MRPERASARGDDAESVFAIAAELLATWEVHGSATSGRGPWPDAA